MLIVLTFERHLVDIGGQAPVSLGRSSTGSVVTPPLLALLDLVATAAGFRTDFLGSTGVRFLRKNVSRSGPRPGSGERGTHGPGTPARSWPPNCSDQFPSTIGIYSDSGKVAEILQLSLVSSLVSLNLRKKCCTFILQKTWLGL